MLDIRIVHERWGSSSNPSLNGQLYDLDRPLNLMRLLLTRTYNTVLVIKSSLNISLHPLLLVLPVREVPDAYTVNLCVFYFYRVIGKLTAFFHLQEFSLCNPIQHPVPLSHGVLLTVQVESGTPPCQVCSLTY
jgi:hypothetical protein